VREGIRGAKERDRRCLVGDTDEALDGYADIPRTATQFVFLCITLY
jgi:hypothetical protein